MKKCEVINEIHSRGLKLPIKAIHTRYAGVAHEGLIVSAPDGIYFLHNNPGVDGAVSKCDEFKPNKFGFKYSWLNFVDITIDNSELITIKSKETNESKITIIEFDTFVSVNQNF